ncbi:Primary amine oxidase [Medicago truncatula]|uniref:Amine oxidase n=1 Tax=Medicago truncatula TaxID=3880 RepID=A0A072URB1_MEDTR|nr:primary amine oxidase [Medicago truncatula]KEH32232.1 copper amine oxidase, enzyme domain protein [Medicago truncatula]RHN64150.1 Primary amine oxidase [Medicago truncatula]
MAFSTTMKLVLFSALTLLSFQSVFSVTPLHFQHPLDPLTKEEFLTVQTLVHNKYPTSKNTVSFHYIGLDDPEKDAILKWETLKPSVITIPRKAFIIAIINGQNHEILIDLRLKRIVYDNVYKGNGFPTLTVDEQAIAIELPKKYPPFIASVQKRGLNLSEVVCSSFTMGWFGEKENRRTVRVDCFMKESTVNIYVRPITGITMVADLSLMKIVEYHDRDVEAVPTAENTDYRVSKQSPPFGPKQHSLASYQPQGPGFQINGHSVSWANWKFHIGFDVRAGIVISLASIYDLEKHKSRRVLYKGYISELFVPYQDPTEEFYFKTFFDSGEFGFGLSTVSLIPNRDCPPHAQFIDTYIHSADGTPSLLKNAICVFEQYGNIMWRHTETGIPNEFVEESRTEVNLIVRTVVTVGNYDNVLDWEFKASGSIKPAIALSGILEIKGTNIKHKDEIKEDLHGKLVSANSIGIYHDHFYMYYLDFDIDGVQNSFEKTSLKTVKITDGSSKRKSYWTTETQIAKTESDAKITLGLAPGELAIVNPNKKTIVGNDVGYRLIPAIPAHPLLTEDDYPQIRGAFTNYNVWVTPYNRTEKWAGGLYVDHSRGEDTLAVWTKKNRDIVNKDIVMWHVVGIHHVPAQEDFPIMPLLSTSFELRPTNFFERNPVLKTLSPRDVAWPGCSK